MPTPAGVGVTVIPTLGNEGFSFDPGFTEGPGQSQDVTIDFQVTAAPGTTLSDLFIFFNGFASGTGSTSFSETYCTIDFTHGCNVFSVFNPPGTLSDHIDIAPTTTLFITKDFGASAGTDGTANLSEVVNQFSSTVPEPGECMLLGTALLALGFLRNKFRRS